MMEVSGFMSSNLAFLGISIDMYCLGDKPNERVNMRLTEDVLYPTDDLLQPGGNIGSGRGYLRRDAMPFLRQDMAECSKQLKQGGGFFTGAFVGMRSQDTSGQSLPADFDYFIYKSNEA